MKQERFRRKWAFTLIELLIVIAIIAILALIAIPNFLEAQVRSRVSRVHADMRSIATAIEAYTVDFQRAPIGGNEGAGGSGAPYSLWTDDTRDELYRQFTTPVAYMTQIPVDPFMDKAASQYNQTSGKTKHLKYFEYQHMQFHAYDVNNDMGRAFRVGYVWYLRSPGPARIVGSPYLAAIVVDNDPGMIYDPTNGTMSIGNIHRTNKGVLDGRNM